MWAVKNINCAPWPGMWLYQNNAAFVLYAVGIKMRDRETDIVEGTGVGWTPGFCSMFSEVVSQPFQGCSSRFSCLWRFSGPLSEQIMCDFSEYHCSHIICSSSSSQTCLHMQQWQVVGVLLLALMVTFFIPLFSLSVKWEMSLVIKFLSPLAQRLRQSKISQS